MKESANTWNMNVSDTVWKHLMTQKSLFSSYCLTTNITLFLSESVLRLIKSDTSVFSATVKKQTSFASGTFCIIMSVVGTSS